MVFFSFLIMIFFTCTWWIINFQGLITKKNPFYARIMFIRDENSSTEIITFGYLFEFHVVYVFNFIFYFLTFLINVNDLILKSSIIIIRLIQNCGCWIEIKNGIINYSHFIIISFQSTKTSKCISINQFWQFSSGYSLSYYTTLAFQNHYQSRWDFTFSQNTFSI